MRNDEIDREIRRRAEMHLPQSRLVADYYRIRRRLAYPLPIRALTIPNLPARGIGAYPWSIWMLWDLEERIHSLGWLAERTGSDAAREAVLADVRALARWPAYRQFDRPDLSLGHCGRRLWYAHTSWSWVREVLDAEFGGAFARLVDDGLPFSDDLHGAFESASDVAALDTPHAVLHNIPFIGTVGLALAAARIGHRRTADLNARLAALYTAMLDLRRTGHSEGVGYDGYILDFVAPWLSGLSEGDRDAILAHPRFDDVLDESIGLAAPGDATAVAEIGDVEPREMPYHLSGHTKVLKWTGDGRRAWLLNRVRLERLRTDALAALRDTAPMPEQPPETTETDCHYAVSLRSGWEGD